MVWVGSDDHRRSQVARACRWWRFAPCQLSGCSEALESVSRERHDSSCYQCTLGCGVVVDFIQSTVEHWRAFLCLRQEMMVTLIQQWRWKWRECIQDAFQKGGWWELSSTRGKRWGEDVERVKPRKYKYVDNGSISWDKTDLLTLQHGL